MATPRPITALLIWLGLARLAIDFDAAIGEARHFGIEPASLTAAAIIAVQLGGSILVVGGRWAWLGAGALSIFTALTTFIAHPFWNVADPMAHFQQRNIFLEHVGRIGGLMFAAVVAEQNWRKE